MTQAMVKRSGVVIGLYVTPKQLIILEFIQKFQNERGLSPTLEEISQSLNVTKVTIFQHINQLERKGWLKKEKFCARSIQLLYDVPTKNEALGYLSGSIECAKVKNSTPDSDDSINMLRGSKIYVVSDESLEEKGILQGEYIIAQDEKPKTGDLVLIQINGEIKIKSYKPEFKTHIQGVIIGTIRSLR